VASHAEARSGGQQRRFPARCFPCYPKAEQMPLSFQPMPLSRRPNPFNHPEWLCELKYDGFRALARFRVLCLEQVLSMCYFFSMAEDGKQLALEEKDPENVRLLIDKLIETLGQEQKQIREEIEKRLAHSAENKAPTV
jgi:hypothetical protein